MSESLDIAAIKEQVEQIKADMDGLTALLHMSLESIHTDSVGIEEVESAVFGVYTLAEIIANKLQDLNKGISQ